MSREWLWAMRYGRRSGPTRLLCVIGAARLEEQLIAHSAWPLALDKRQLASHRLCLFYHRHRP